MVCRCIVSIKEDNGIVDFICVEDISILDKDEKKKVTNLLFHPARGHYHAVLTRLTSSHQEEHREGESMAPSAATTRPCIL